MAADTRVAAWIVRIACVCGLIVCGAGTLHAQGNVVMGFDALMAINSNDAGGTVMGSNPGFGGFGRFSYGGMTLAPSTDLGRYGAFEIRKDGAGGSGMGFNFTSSVRPITRSTPAPSSPMWPQTCFRCLDRGCVWRELRSQPIRRGAGLSSRCRRTTATR